MLSNIQIELELYYLDIMWDSFHSISLNEPYNFLA